MRLFFALPALSRGGGDPGRGPGGPPGPGPGELPPARENLHLTLAFLGESSLKPAQQALHQLSGPSFAMTVEGVGRFRRDGGDILWAGVRKNPDLSALAGQVQQAFSQKGFSLEKRPFAAHLTLAGRCCCPRV